jgi:hypothetical protein
VLRIEDERFLEAAPTPRILLSSEPGVGDSDVQFYRMWIKRKAFSQDIQRLIVLALVVQLMGALIVLFRTQEWSRHLSNPLRLERAGQ